MATHRFRLLLVVVAMMSIAVAESVLEDVMQQQQEGWEPADAGGYRTYLVFLATPTEAELNEFIKDGGGGGEDDVIAAHRAWHQSFLPSTRTSLGGPRLLLSSLHTGIYGFTARLTEDELKVVSGKPGFMHAYPDFFCSKDSVEF
ncbi:hypothetical protein EJB05_03608, partial [Eragrostis curvula]